MAAAVSSETFRIAPKITRQHIVDVKHLKNDLYRAKVLGSETIPRKYFCLFIFCFVLCFTVRFTVYSL